MLAITRMWRRERRIKQILRDQLKGANSLNSQPFQVSSFSGLRIFLNDPLRGGGTWP